LSIFETLMILSFGAAWPVSIIKSWKAKTTKGKSLFFLFIVEFGYIAGITHKILYSRDIVIVFYLINFFIIMLDILIYFRNRRIENKLQKSL